MTLNLDFTEGGWFDGLVEGQRNLIDAMLSNLGNEEEVAKVWLSKPGSATNAGFGGESPTLPVSFFSNVKSEFVGFVCGAERYDTERKQAAEIWGKAGKPGLVSFVAVAIAPHVGLAVVAIIPVIALLFSLMSKVTVGAFCTTYGNSPGA